MTQAELVQEILSKCPELTHREAVRFLQATIESIREALLRGEDVKISGLGTWKTKLRRPRISKIPGKGTRKIATAPIAQWHPSDKIREELEKADQSPFEGKA